MYTGPVGFVMWMCKIIFINRSRTVDAKLMLERLVDVIKKERVCLYVFILKVSVFMFPEGTRSDSGCFLPFKKGAFHMAISSQVYSFVLYLCSYQFNLLLFSHMISF